MGLNIVDTKTIVMKNNPIADAERVNHNASSVKSG